ncbi:TPA: fumarylacetoacetate hydrolase [Candidatus Poribacteria bacterium]|nr:fumarylacetoacetate hydrolase [Chloroflexota bacterium]MQG03865.1 fumarylacetoacetate hydrolase family protein [SAR202 cluster bacterium]HAE33600.1 fumarylacetoacetate hydrolase [Dehalococcoidia bacterium]HCK14861.1 fumarylacetoacetate hydrolase [Candidatus Poribacteria bacterium]|tara:strand:- start:3021 stop:3791 length:771 start_codon:yes stop_codon:yes gene_type:complete
MTTFARFEIDGTVLHGIVEGHAIKEISGSPLNDYSETGNSHNLQDVKLLPPVSPRKIVAIGLNYRSHLGDKPGPAAPEPFLKSSTTVVGQGDNIVIPKVAIEEGVKIQPEAELALVIGKDCKGATQENALDYVFAYTCGNDVSARDWQANDLQWARAKSSDTFGPIGPWMTTDLDPTNIQVICRVNGEEKQNQNTSDLLHPVTRIIEYVSSVITLQVGDVIMTGTPGTPGDIHPGDVVEVELSGVGVLTNPVVAES